MNQVERGSSELVDSVDTMIVIPTNVSLLLSNAGLSLNHSAWRTHILRQAVQGISDIITIPGIINRDFADVKTIMQGMGHAVMGTAVPGRAPCH